MNILVTGANGQLGNEMRFIAQDSIDHYVFTDVSQADELETLYLDITDLAAVRGMVAQYKIDAIVNCAAYTNVDKAETDVDTSRMLNANASANLAAAMKETGGLLIHVSTDYVFNGQATTPYTEDAVTAPTGVYGQTKLEGEQAVQSSGCRYIIIRTAWLYSEFGRNFVKTMIGLTSSKPQIKVVFDQTGTPTYALDLAEAIFDIVENRKAAGNDGIYHFSNEGVCSWYDFAKAIFDLGGISTCTLKPLHTEEYPTPAARPHFSVLDKSKIKRVYGVEVPYWVDSLRDCMAQL